MTTIPQGAPFQVVLQGQTTLTKSADEILAEMTPYLSSNGLSVLSTGVAASGALSFISLGAFGSYIATLNIQSYSDTDDITVTNEVAQAYQLVTKLTPLSISVPSISGSSTGQPSPSGITTSSIGDSISGFFTQLETAGTSLLIGLAAVVIIVLLIVAYGPNVKHVAATL
jgi:hypothetical protein